MSDFEAYLSGQSGEVDSVGGFTIDKQRAIEKLSDFSLPFEGAWALKLVQAGVKSGEVLSIDVTQGKEENTFAFPGDYSWRAEKILVALTDPTYAEDTSEQHLVMALRDVGFRQGRPFRFEFRNQPKCLVWSGTELEVQTLDGLPEDSKLKVSLRTPTDGHWTYRTARKAARARNVRVSRALNEYAFTCPVALSLDRRRLDSIDHCPHHGYGVRSQLLALTCHKPKGFDLFRVPTVGSKHEAPPETGAKRPRHPVLAQATSRVRKNPESECGVAILIAVHVGGTDGIWKFGSDHSRVNWVKDGVVIQSSILELPKGRCSVGMFLSADELSTDLTSFNLRDSQAALAKQEIALRLAPEGLQALLYLDPEKFVDVRPKSSMGFAVPLMAVGAIASIFVPFKGIPILMLGIGVAGGSRNEHNAKMLTEGLEELAQVLKESIGRA